MIPIHVCTPSQGQGFSSGLCVRMKRGINEAPRPLLSLLHVKRRAEQGQKAEWGYRIVQAKYLCVRVCVDRRVLNQLVACKPTDLTFDKACKRFG